MIVTLVKMLLSLILTITEILQREETIRAVPLAVRVGTRDTQLHKWSSRGGTSREEAVQPISSAAFDSSHYILLEPEFPVEKMTEDQVTTEMKASYIHHLTTFFFSNYQYSSHKNTHHYFTHLLGFTINV